VDQPRKSDLRGSGGVRENFSARLANFSNFDAGRTIRQGKENRKWQFLHSWSKSSGPAKKENLKSSY